MKKRPSLTSTLFAASSSLLLTITGFAAPAESAAEVEPLEKGAAIPAVTLKTADGKDFALQEKTADKPTVIVFYRGGWCPFCTRQMAELGQSQQELADMGYQILAIGADASSALSATAEKHDLGYTLLSDAEMKASDAFGLAFYLDESTSKRYEKRFNLPSKHEGRYWLPVPAVYIVGKDGKIAFAHIDANYRKRLPIEDLLKAAKEAS